jgi:hypothetical protein
VPHTSLRLRVVHVAACWSGRVIDNTTFSKKATGIRFLTFQVRRVRDTTARRVKQTMPDQGATERRDSLRGVSKGEVDSIRARER